MNDRVDPRAALPQGRNPVERVLYALAALVILVLAFFFLTVALVAGAFLATAVALRWWWITRKLRAARDRGVYEADYTVVRDPADRDPVLPRD